MSDSDMLQTLERLVLAHRYLYYVKATPILSDYDYDMLERRAEKVLPETSPVHDVGSDSPGSYSAEVKALAESLSKRHS